MNLFINAPTSAIRNVRLLFFLQSLLIGNLLVRIPDIKENASIDKAELGIAFMGFSLGSVSMLPIAGLIATRIGIRPLLFFGFILYSISLSALGLATSFTNLFLLEIVAGTSIALTEVGINTHASNVERNSGKLIMSSAHGCWTLGEMAGSLAGVALAALSLSVFSSAMIVTVLSLPIALLLVRTIPAVSKEEHHAINKSHRKFRLTVPLIILGFFLMGSALIEGSGAEWSTLYMLEITDWTVAEAGLTVTLYAVTLSIFRFTGDYLATRFTAMKVARFLGIFGLVGLALVALQISIPLVFLGFGLVAAGIALSFPLAMSAAGRMPGNPASNIAFLTFMVFAAFFSGGPIMGMIAEATNLRWSYATLIPILIITLGCAGALSHRYQTTKNKEEEISKSE